MLRVVQNLVVPADDIVTNKGYEKVVRQKDPVAVKSSTDSTVDEEISHTTSVRKLNASFTSACTYQNICNLFTFCLCIRC